MNCNEEFVVKALGKLTLEFNLDLEQQRKVREILYLSLYNFQVTNIEKALVKSDIEEKVMYFIQVKKLEGYSEKTLKGYYRILMDFASVVNKPVSTVNKNDVRMYLARKAGHLKASTFNTLTYSIKSFFSWLESEEIIPNNPTKKLPVNKLPKRLRKSLTMEEIEKLRVASKTDRERALIEFLFATGCRVSEVVGVDVAHINFYNNSLRVIGKGDKERTVFFNDKAKFYIRKYLDTRPDNNPALFIGERKPYARLQQRAIEKIVEKIAKRTDLNKNIFPHLLRHSFATLGLQAGADITTIQHLLGHTSVNTSQTYAEQSIDNIGHEYKQHFTH